MIIKIKDRPRSYTEKTLEFRKKNNQNNNKEIATSINDLAYY